jgi:hypothetical protein
VNGWWTKVQRSQEEREVDHPEELVLRLVDQLELVAELRAQSAEHALDHRHGVCREQDGRARRRGERLELLLREELRDRRADLSRLVHDEVGEALRPPLLRDLLEPPELRAREGTGGDEEANRLGAREDPEL